KLQLAHEGTLYLDGVNHLSGFIQSKLLRFAQERQVEPLGSSQVISVNCRLISSCSMPLEICIKQKQIREDLFYRLASVTIDLPALRQRMEDLPALIADLMDQISKKYSRQCTLDH